VNELIVNLHIHTQYSDGGGTHAEVLQAAQAAGLDVVIVTDHNILVQGIEGYYGEGKRRVLLLAGEEVHDQARQPQKSHLLVIGANRELATFAHNPQRLVEVARKSGGLSFIAHPVDPPAPAFNESDISWADWDVIGMTGLEIWNGFSEFKTHLKSKPRALFYALQPERIASRPFAETLRIWDEKLAAGQRLVGIGSSDAHALRYRWGLLRRIIFPYEFHFRAINTHLLTPTPLSGELESDRRRVLEALQRGRAFIGYDLPAPTRGFRFTAQGRDGKAWMGDSLSGREGVTFQIRLPRPVHCRLIHNGRLVRAWERRETCMYTATQPGAYRVEADIEFRGKTRGWIYSNPIYVV
jgi:hypothetical protein